MAYCLRQSVLVNPKLGPHTQYAKGKAGIKEADVVNPSPSLPWYTDPTARRGTRLPDSTGRAWLSLHY